MKRKAIIVLCFTNMLTLGILTDTSRNNAYTISKQNKQINQLAQYRISNNTLQDNIDIQNTPLEALFLEKHRYDMTLTEYLEYIAKKKSLDVSDVKKQWILFTTKS